MDAAMLNNEAAENTPSNTSAISPTAVAFSTSSMPPTTLDIGSAEPKSTIQQKHEDEEEETRVITLDTIIRKGLVERMPMTAKDVINIVSKSMQKERERQAADKARLAAKQTVAALSTASASTATPIPTIRSSSCAQSSYFDDESKRGQKPRYESDSSETTPESSNYDSQNEESDDDEQLEDSSGMTGHRSATTINPQLPSTVPISVIQRAPPNIANVLKGPTPNEVQAEDLRTAAAGNIVAPQNDALEDCDVRFGDLHYSESNTSDFSDDLAHRHERHKQHQHQPTARRKRNPLATAGTNTKPDNSTAAETKARRIGVNEARSVSAGSSCTDSKRNAILMQCSAASSAVYKAPKALGSLHTVDEKNDDTTERRQSTLQIDQANLIQIQHIEHKDIVNVRDTQPPKMELVENCAQVTIEMPHVGDVHLTKVKATSKRVSKPAKLPVQSRIDSAIKKRGRKKSVANTIGDAVTDLTASATVKPAKRPYKRKPLVKSETPVISGATSTAPATMVVPAGSATGSDTPRRLHWKTILKLQRLQQQQNEHADECISEPTEIKMVAENVHTTSEVVAVVDQDDDLKSTESQTSNISSSPTRNNAKNRINKILEPPHNQKRIPKLKYGSFNFSDRRSVLTKGPKMVLKYKKKYKRKPTIATLQSLANLNVANDENGTEMVAVDEMVAVNGGSAVVQHISQPIPTKTYVKKRRLATAKSPPNVSDVASTSRRHSTGDEPPHKQSKTNSNSKLLNVSKATDIGGPPDTTRALRERNKVLLELLEHRIYEIRHLKLRLAHMQHTNSIHSPPVLGDNGNANMTPVFPTMPYGASNAAKAPPMVSLSMRRPKIEPGIEQSAGADPAMSMQITSAIASTSSTAAAAATVDVTPDWSIDELAQAHSLYSLNPLLYAHLQQCYSLPLPLPTECVAWSSGVRLDCDGQLLNDMLRIMHTAGTHLSALQRVSVLHVTDVPLRPSHEYDERTDRLSHSTARRLYVVWARGLHANWQRPLYLSTAAAGAMDELVNAVKMAAARLHAIQYTVIACCARFMTTARGGSGESSASMGSSIDEESSGGSNAATKATTKRSDGGNNSCGGDDESCANGVCGGDGGAGSFITGSQLFQRLGVGRGYTYFSHPTTNEPVYTFFFGGDLLCAVQRQLLRNSSTGGGFRSAADTHTATVVPAAAVHITRQPIDSLRTVASSWHADVTASDSVRLLFAKRTSELLRVVRPPGWAVCADFVDVFGAFAQLLYDEEYGGERLEAQMQTLSRLQLFLFKLREGSSDSADESGVGLTEKKSFEEKDRRSASVVPVAATAGPEPRFKAATIHTIESLKLLQHSMRQKFSVDSFPSRSVTEDILRQRWLVPDVNAVKPAAVCTLREAIERLRVMAVQPPKQAEHDETLLPRIMLPTTTTIDVSRPERQYVQQLIDGLVEPFATLAERQKLVADLWRMEDRFQSLWTPFFVGGSNNGGSVSGSSDNTHINCSSSSSGGGAVDLIMHHVLRDTLGKVKSGASLECAVRFMQQRIALRVSVVNALGGVERWPSYVLRTSASAVAAAAAAAAAARGSQD